MQYHRWGTTVLLALWVGLVAAQMESVPSCALKCLEELIPGSNCAPTDQACICTDVKLNEELSLCVAGNCTIKESLTTLNATKSACGAPIRDNTAPSIIIPSVGLCVLLLVALRIYTRLVISKLDADWDDWAAILLGCCIVPVNVGSILLGKTGLGKDIWTLEFHQITRILYLFYIQELLYITCISLTKICFLLFYMRIFPSTGTRRVIKVSAAVTFCYLLTFLFAFSFQCSPVSFNWNGWNGEHAGKCVKTNTLVVTAAALNIVLDFWVICLPIPDVLKVQISTNKKLQILFMFSLGFLITGVSIYRTVMLKIFATSTNATWDNAAGGYWSIIEVDVGVFCLCMPALRTFLGHLYPSVFGSTRGTSTVEHPISHNKPRAPEHESNTSFVPLVDMDPLPPKSHQDDH